MGRLDGIGWHVEGDRRAVRGDRPVMDVSRHAVCTVVALLETVMGHLA